MSEPGAGARLPTRRPARRWARRWGRRAGLLALAAALLIPVGAGLTRLELDTGLTSVLDGGDPAVQAIEQKASTFGGDPVVVVLESEDPRSLLVDADQLPALARLEGELSRLPDVAAVYGPGTVVNQVATGARGLLAEIAGKRAMVERLAARSGRKSGLGKAQLRRLQREALARFDARYGALLAQGMPAGLPTVYNPAFAQATIFGADGKPKPQWRFVVPSERAVAIVVRPRQGMDEAADRALAADVRRLVDDAGIRFSRATISGLPVISAELSEEIRATAPWIAALALIGCALALTLVPRRGTWRTRLVPVGVMAGAGAALLAVFGLAGWPVSVGVLALFPILLGIGADFPMYLAQGIGRRRVLASGLASAVAAGCLAVSPLPVVRELGITLAAGILVVVVVSLMLARWGALPVAPVEPSASAPSAAPRRLTGPVVAAAVAAATVAALGWALLPHLKVDADPESLAAGLPALSDAEHVEAAIGASAELSISLRGDDVLSAAAMAWSRDAVEAVVSRFGDQVRPVLNPADLLGFLGADATPDQVSAALDLVPAYLTSSVVTSDRRQALLIFGVALQDIGDQAALLDKIGAALPAPPDGIDYELVGSPVVASSAYRDLESTRYLTSAVGILAAGLVLLIGLRSPTEALRAVLAGSVATGWGFAILWAAGVSLTPLTVALGALTTVLGCEFLVVLATAGGDAATSRRAAFAAGLNSAIGYLALTISPIVMMRDFGLVMAGTVALALIAALGVVRLPAPAWPSLARLRIAPPPREEPT